MDHAEITMVFLQQNANNNILVDIVPFFFVAGWVLLLIRAVIIYFNMVILSCDERKKYREILKKGEEGRRLNIIKKIGFLFLVISSIVYLSAFLF